MTNLRPVPDRRDWEENDLYYALEASGDYSLKVEEIEGLAALIPGQNDELDWYWIAKVRDHEQPWALIKAGCDYTGWGCRDGCEVWYHPTAEAAALAAPEYEESWRRDPRPIRVALRDQVRGVLPYGMVVIEAETVTKGLAAPSTGEGETQ